MWAQPVNYFLGTPTGSQFAAFPGPFPGNVHSERIFPATSPRVSKQMRSSLSFHFLFLWINYPVQDLKYLGLTHYLIKGDLEALTLFQFLAFIRHGEGDVHAIKHTYPSEGNLGKPVLSFYHVSSGDWTQVLRLGGWSLHLLQPSLELLILLASVPSC